MKYNIKNGWIAAFETILKNPVVMMPFVIIAFFECLGLEIAYFSARSPLSVIFNPIVRKFHGEPFLHYPANLMVLPKLFYNAQVLIYIFIGVFLTAVSVQLIVNIWTKHPIIPKAIMKNTARRYAAFVIYGVGYVALTYILEKAGAFVILKAAGYISRHFFKIPQVMYSITSLLILVLNILILQTLIILTVPIIVIEKKGLFKAIIGSLSTAVRNFFTIFSLMVLPFALYLPVMMLKIFSGTIMDKTFPEISVFILILNIAMSVFIDSFIIVCVTQFLLKARKIT